MLKPAISSTVPPAYMYSCTLTRTYKHIHTLKTQTNKHIHNLYTRSSHTQPIQSMHTNPCTKEHQQCSVQLKPTHMTHWNVVTKYSTLRVICNQYFQPNFTLLPKIDQLVPLKQIDSKTVHENTSGSKHGTTQNTLLQEGNKT